MSVIFWRNAIGGTCQGYCEPEELTGPGPGAIVTADDGIALGRRLRVKVYLQPIAGTLSIWRLYAIFLCQGFGSLSTIVAGCLWKVPSAQLGLQSSASAVPLPVAVSLPQPCQEIPLTNRLPSPDRYIVLGLACILLLDAQPTGGEVQVRYSRGVVETRLACAPQPASGPMTA